MRVNPVSDSLIICDYFCKLNGILNKYYGNQLLPEKLFLRENLKMHIYLNLCCISREKYNRSLIQEKPSLQFLKAEAQDSTIS